MDCDCKSVFNRLSQADRLKLRGAALTKAVTGFVRDDTERNPIRYPFYAAYLLIVGTPLPFPFAATALLGATVVWARYSKSEYAQRLNGRLKEAFNHAAMVCEHKEHMEPDPEKEGCLKVKNGALAWGTTKRAFADTWQATKHAGNAFKKFVIG